MLQIQHATNGMDNWLLEAGNDVIREYIQHGHLDQGRDFLGILFWFCVTGFHGNNVWKDL